MMTSSTLCWMAAANALAGILQTENDALRAIDFAAAIALLPAKRAAIQRLESLTPNGVEEKLRAAASRLDRLSQENRKLLSRSIVIQSQVLGVIAGAARNACSLGYGSSGKAAGRTGALTLSARA